MVREESSTLGKRPMRPAVEVAPPTKRSRDISTSDSPSTSSSIKASARASNTISTSDKSSESVPPICNLSYNFNFEIASPTDPNSVLEFTTSGNAPSAFVSEFFDIAKAIAEIEESSKPILSHANDIANVVKDMIPARGSHRTNEAVMDSPGAALSESSSINSAIGEAHVEPQNPSGTTAFIIVHTLWVDCDESFGIHGIYLNLSDANRHAQHVGDEIFGTYQDHPPHEADKGSSTDKFGCLQLTYNPHDNYHSKVYVEKQTIKGGPPDKLSLAAPRASKDPSNSNRAKGVANALASEPRKASGSTSFSRPQYVYNVVHAYNHRHGDEELEFEVCGSYLDTKDANNCVKRVANEQYGHLDFGEYFLEKRIDDDGCVHVKCEHGNGYWVRYIQVIKQRLLLKGSEKETSWPDLEGGNHPTEGDGKKMRKCIDSWDRAHDM